MASRALTFAKAGGTVVTLTIALVLVMPFGATAQTITGTALPDSARMVLAEIMQQAGVKSVVVTRTRSSPEDQVRVMYNFIRRYGVDSAKRMYGSEGDAVVDAYVAFQSDASESDASESDASESDASQSDASQSNVDSRKAAMLAELIRQLPAAQTNGRLMHLSADYTVFDLSLSRFVPQDSVEAFVELARKHAKTKRVLGRDEGEKEAIHVELTK